MITYLKYCFVLILLVTACKEQEDKYTNQFLETEFKQQINFYEQQIKINSFSFQYRIRGYVNEKFYFDAYDLFRKKTEGLYDTINQLNLSMYSKETYLTKYGELSNDLISYGNTFITQPQNKRAFLPDDLPHLVFTQKDYTAFAKHYSLEVLKLYILRNIKEYEYKLFYKMSAIGCHRVMFNEHPFRGDFNLSILQKNDSCFISINEAEIMDKLSTNYKLQFNSLSKINKMDTIPIYSMDHYFTEEVSQFKFSPLKLAKGKYRLNVNIVFTEIISEEKVNYPTSFIFDVK